MSCTSSSDASFIYIDGAGNNRPYGEEGAGGGANEGGGVGSVGVEGSGEDVGSG